MNQAAIRDLLDLLPLIFTPEDLRQWIPDLPDGTRIVNALPGGAVAPANYFFAAVDTFRRYGLLAIPEFWDPLEEIAPMARKPRVRELREKFGVTAAPSKPSSAPPPQPSAPPQPAASQPAKITVALVSASPEREMRIRVDRESQRIIEKVATTPARDRIRFEHANAARFEDLRAVLLRYQPHVLHISSHGQPDGSLLFEARDGSGGQAVSKRQLLGLLAALNDNLRIVVVNACYSQELARDIPPNIDVAIGMHTAVEDETAIEFAASFYESLGYGKTIEKAFKIGLASLADDAENIPALFPPADQDPDHKRKLVLIKP